MQVLPYLYYKIYHSLQKTNTWFNNERRDQITKLKFNYGFSLHLGHGTTLEMKLGALKQSSSPTVTRLTILLSRAKTLKHATEIHAQLITRKCISVPPVFNTLLNLYSKCGEISQSILLFSSSPFDSTKNVFTYTSLITKFSHFNLPHKALTTFTEMRGRSIFPNHFTFSAVLPSCNDLMSGKQIHSLVHKQGCDADVFVSSALVDMYSKSGEIGCARRLFDEMPERNLISWNSLLVGFLSNGLYDDAINFFANLITEDKMRPDQVTMSSVLSACANVCKVEIGRQVHGVAVKQGLNSLIYVLNSLLDMYSKCGVLDDAEKLFKTTENKDVVTWNVIVVGLAQNGNFEEACNYFWIMRREGIFPDEASFSTILYAAAGIAALDQGTLIHNQIIKTGFLGNICISSALVTMYAKCGSLFDAKRAFAENDEHNVVSWTAMISAFQQHGNTNQAIELFEQMLKTGVTPDHITFVSVLSACGHTGRVNEGFSYFNLMTEGYNIVPGPEHFACMVDLLGRAGQLHEAKRFMETMPIEPDVSTYGALLGACRKYGNLDMGREVAERLFELEPDNPGNYVLLSNMYAHRGSLEEAKEVRRLMGFNKIRKEPGCSWLDVKNKTYVFTAHDRSHSLSDEIYDMLKKMEVLVKQKGYFPEIQYAINDIEEYKEQSLWYHSEKLALAFGLLILPVGAPIRIKKNLRTCGDCHVVMKFASEIFKREIIVRDINRFHRFVDGSCSCGDYW